MISLYEQDPTHWDRLAAEGRTHLREAAKRFSRCVDMNRALGVTAASAHWHTGRNGASWRSDMLAKAWLEANPVGAEQPTSPPPTSDDGVTFLMFAAPTDTAAAKLRKVATMLDCEEI